MNIKPNKASTRNYAKGGAIEGTSFSSEELAEELAGSVGPNGPSSTLKATKAASPSFDKKLASDYPGWPQSSIL